MGKLNFEAIYQGAAEELGTKPGIKLSTFCDPWDPNANYAGLIIYHTYGSYQWRQRQGQGVAGGHNGRAFYVLISCTDNWPPEAFGRAKGKGLVHDFLYRMYFNMEFTAKKSCCGGFSIQQGEIKYSSIWLNQQENLQKGRMSWQQDGSKYLSLHEQTLVNLAIDRWKEAGRGAVAEVPEKLHLHLMNVDIHHTKLPTGHIHNMHAQPPPPPQVRPQPTSPRQEPRGFMAKLMQGCICGA